MMTVKTEFDLPCNYDELQPAARKTVREAYIELQGGLCHQCKHPLSGKPPAATLKLRVNRKLFPPNFFKYPVHLHHNHDTGMTIGAVHNYCNAVLWQYHGE